MLIASHIVPWSVSDNANRLKPENGLLLSATNDKLFDCGLITFKDIGEIVPSRNHSGCCCPDRLRQNHNQYLVQPWLA